jgi:hypothetical protein
MLTRRPRLSAEEDVTELLSELASIISSLDDAGVLTEASMQEKIATIVTGEGWSPGRLRRMVAGMQDIRSSEGQEQLHSEYLRRKRPDGKSGRRWTQSVSALQSDKVQVRRPSQTRRFSRSGRVCLWA